MANIKKVKEAKDKISDRFDRIDILVNNAAIASFALFEDMSEKDRDRIINVNFNK